MDDYYRKIQFILFLIFFSFHSKAQWIQIPSPESDQITSICFPNNSTAYLSSYDNVYKSVDGAITWDTLGYPLPTFTDTLIWSGRLKEHLFFTSVDTGFAAGRDIFANTELIMKTTDGGLTWLVKHSSFTGGQLKSIHFPSSTIGYAVGLSGRKLKSTDGGQTWTLLPFAGISEALNDIFFVTNSTGYLISSNKIYKTTNGGTTWSIISSTGGECIWFTDIMNGYAGTGSGTVMRTTNGGVTWTSVSLGEIVPVNDIQFINDSSGYICTSYAPGSSGKIFKTSDYGMHWEPQPSSFGVTLLDVCFIDENTGFVVGDNGTIKKTINGGGSVAPIALFTNDNPQFCDSITNFSNLGPTSYNYTWLINGTVVANSYNFSYAFPPSSTNSVSLIADNGFYTDTLTSSISTPAPPDLNLIFTANSDTICATNSATLFVLNSLNGAYYRFKSGSNYLTGNIYGTGGTLSYTTTSLTASTSFTVEATITTACGNHTDTSDITIYVISYPTINNPISALQNPICEGDSVTFMITSTQTDVKYWIVKYAPFYPSVSDTIIGSGDTIYLKAFGLGTFQFAAQKSPSCPTYYSQQKIIINERTLNVDFYTDGTTYIANDTLAFHNMSDADSYIWQFPGATVSSATNFEPSTIIYPSGGIYNITLIGNTLEGCSDTSTSQISIFNQAPSGSGTYCWTYNENANQYTYFPTYGGSYPFKTHSISDEFIDNKGNVYVTGFYKQSVYPYDPKYNFFIRKLDKNGNLLWSKYMMGGNDNREINSFIAGITGDTAGNIYIAGTVGTDFIDFGNGITLSYNSGILKSDFIAKYNSNGDALWARSSAGFGGNSTSTDIVTGNKNDIYVSIIGSNPSLIIHHYDTNGNFLDELLVPLAYGQAIETSQTLNSNFVVGTQIPMLSPKMKFDKNGDLLVAGRNYNSDLILGNTTIPCSTLEEIYFVGIIDTSTFTWLNAFPIARFSYTTSPLYGPHLSDFLSFDIDNNNDIYFAASWRGSHDTSTTLVIGNDTIPIAMKKSAFIARYNKNGNVIWHNLADATGIRSLAVASNNNVYLYGKIKDDIHSASVGFYSQTLPPAGISETGNTDYFLGEYSPSGELISVNNIIATHPAMDILQEGGILERSSCGDLYFTALGVTQIIGTDSLATGQEQLTVTKFAADNFCTKLLCTPTNGPIISAISNGSLIEICDKDSTILIINWASVGIDSVNILYSLNGSPFLPLVNNYPDVNSPYYFSTADSGTYAFIISNSANISIADTIFNMTINTIPTPVLIVSNDTSICEGATVNLNATADMLVNYIWLPGGDTTSNVNFAPTTTTQYTVSVTNNENCSSQDTITVNVNTPPFASIYYDTSLGILVGTPSELGVFTYQWYLSSNPITGATDTTYTPITDGPYSLTITNSQTGCSYTTPILDVEIISINESITESILISNTNSLLTISSINSTHEEIYNISIIDVNGKTILFSIESIGGANTATEISLEKLSSGCYILSMESATRKLHKRIIKV